MRRRKLDRPAQGQVLGGQLKGDENCVLCLLADCSFHGTPLHPPVLSWGRSDGYSFLLHTPLLVILCPFSQRQDQRQAIQLEVTLESEAACAFSLLLCVKPPGGLSPTQNSTQNR